MPTYTTKRFGGLLLMSCAIGIIAVGFTTWGVGIFSTIPRVYQQLVGYGSTEMSSLSVQQWAQLNHTLVILDDNVMKSILTVTAKEEPYNSENQMIIISIDFEDPSSPLTYTKNYPLTYTNESLVPRIIDGNLSWSGKFPEDIELNQTIIISTTLRFDNDGEYHINGVVILKSIGGMEGLITRYYVTVEHGKIVKVRDKLEQPPPSAQMSGERVDNDTPTDITSLPPWAQTNHTLTILDDNVIESKVNVTAKTEPPLPYVMINVQFLPYMHYDLPRSVQIVDGSLYWSGELHENQTAILRTTFKLDGDGEYALGSWIHSYKLHFEMLYFIRVEDGKIVKVTEA